MKLFKILRKNSRFLKHFVVNLLIMCMLLGVYLFTLPQMTQFVFGQANEEAIYYGNRSSNKISLLINVYWGNEFIQPMLEVLKDHQVHTTFFVGGSWVEKNQDLLQAIYENGHEIGNHGYFHKDHNKLNYEQNYNEINITTTIVKNVIGIDMNLFAPPSGAFNKTTLTVANKLGYKTIMWSKDTIDWRDKDTNIILSRATKNVKGGEFILMHPTQNTLNALDSMLTYYEKNNLKVVKVSDALK